MKAVILAAGKGLKMKARGEVPACMVKIGGKSLLEYNFSQLPSQIKEVIIVVGHLKSKIKDHVGKNLAERPVRFIEQKERLGTAHALSLCKDILADDRFVVLMGDNLYLKNDINKCLLNDLAVLVKKLEVPESFGMVEERAGFLSKAKEGPRSPAGTFIDCGLYVLDKRLFEFPMVQSDNGDFRILRQVEQMSQKYRVRVEKANLWMPTSTLQDIKNTNKYIKKIFG
jgi:glucose-1-phosphate thymidylyltransferase